MLGLLSFAEGNIWSLPFEIPFITWLQSLGGKGTFLCTLMNLISACGEEFVLVAVLGLVYWGLDKRRGEKIGAFMITATLLNPMIKNVARRQRPWDASADVQVLRPETGFSFPSGHSSGSSSVFFGSAVAYKDKKIKWLWPVGIVVPVLVALSRNYLGAHYPTDVVVGLAMGVGITFLLNWLMNIVPNKYFVYGGILIVGLAGFFYCKTDDFFTGYGIALGFTFGVLIEERIVNFRNTKVWWRVLLRVAVGGVLFLGLNVGLKTIVGLFGDKVCTVCGTPYSLCLNTAEHAAEPWFMAENHAWFERIFRMLRYAVIVFLMIGVYPLLFAQTEKLWKKWGWWQTDDTLTGKLPKEQSAETADETAEESAVDEITAETAAETADETVGGTDGQEVAESTATVTEE